MGRFKVQKRFQVQKRFELHRHRRFVILDLQSAEALYRSLSQSYSQFKNHTLRQHARIDRANYSRIEDTLIEREVELSLSFISELSETAHPEIVNIFYTTQPDGAACVPTSLANALMSMHETHFQGSKREKEQRVARFTKTFRAQTFEGTINEAYRNLDQVARFFEEDLHRSAGIRGSYDFRLTDSLLDIVYHLYTGKGMSVVLAGNHAELAFGVQVRGDEVSVRMRNPMSQRPKNVSLAEFARTYVFSPLKDAPRSISRGGGPYLAETLIQAHARQELEGNRYIGCTSGILVKR